MLVLSRKDGEAITIDSGITITILGITQGKVKLGFDAPNIIRINRTELVQGGAYDSEDREDG